MSNHANPLAYSNPPAHVGNRASWEEGSTGFGVTGFGKLGNGNISGWARGISKPFGSVFKPKRPECNGDNRTFSPPVRSLKNVKPVDCEPGKHDPKSVVIPLKGKGIDYSDMNKIDELMASRARIRQRLSDNFNRVYAELGKTGPEVVKEYA